MTTANMVDLTDLTDLTVDALFAWRAGDESFDWDALSSVELRDLARCLPGVDLRCWIAVAEAAERAARPVRTSAGYDYEGAILREQETRFAGE